MFDEEHLDDHYECQREVAERDQRIVRQSDQLIAQESRIRELEAALREQTEKSARLESALRLLYAEMVASGNERSTDYGWTPAIKASREALGLQLDGSESTSGAKYG